MMMCDSLITFIQLSRRFRRRHCFAHEKQFDNTPGNQQVDKHGEQGGPFKNTAFNLRCLKTLRNGAAKG
jgi:hypothetical protein